MDSNMVVNIKNHSCDVYIGRGSKWGNPYPITSKRGRGAALLRYEEYLRNNEELLEDLSELEGKVLGCWCKPLACHGDILVQLLKEKVVENV